LEREIQIFSRVQFATKKGPNQHFFNRLYITEESFSGHSISPQKGLEGDLKLEKSLSIDIKSHKIYIGQDRGLVDSLRPTL
jgi:hypothetical protein